MTFMVKLFTGYEQSRVERVKIRGMVCPFKRGLAQLFPEADGPK